MIIRSILQTGEPNHAALITSAGAITYSELASQIDDLAEQLTNLGLRSGDRIAMALPNGLEVIASFLAASTVGTAAPLNPAYTRDEFKFYLEDTAARALIVPRAAAPEARAAAGENILLIEADRDDEGRVHLFPAGRVNAPDAPAADDDVALIL